MIELDSYRKGSYTTRRIVSVLLVASVLLACSAMQRVIEVPAGVTEQPLNDQTATVTAVIGTPLPSPTITVTATPPFECPTAPETQFKVGDSGRVTFTEGPAVRLRREPVVEGSNIIKLLADGTKFEVIGGPECGIDPESGAAFVFWQIRISGDPLKGWVAEGDAKEYFIEPLP